MSKRTDPAFTQDLWRFINDNAPLCAITGAGCSTPSGIFDYRDQNGEWKRPQPVHESEFLNSTSARQRYWARSMLGWSAFRNAEPNAVHRVLRQLEVLNLLASTVTQNVDNLHQQMNQRHLIPLHGSLQTASCVECGITVNRDSIQDSLETHNERYLDGATRSDAGGEGIYNKTIDESFWIPVCCSCGGFIKPDVVFFGGSLEPSVKESATDAIRACKGLLVLGSSLMVYSSFRLVRQAHSSKIPIAAVNLGVTRADELFDIKIEREVSEVFRQLEIELSV